MRFSSRLYLLLVIFSIGFIVFGFLAKNTIDTIKVTGPVYTDIVTDKDLIADILPPPRYIIEAYLVVLQSLDSSLQDGPAVTAARIKSLKKEYDERHVFWTKTLRPGAKRDLMLAASYQPAIRFFTEVEEKFLPALAAGDLAAAQGLAYGSLKQQYQNHRLAIDKLVKLATEDAAANENMANSIITKRNWMMLLIGLAILISSAAMGIFIVRQLLARLGGEPEDVAAIVERVSDGDLTLQSVDTSSRSLMAAMGRMLESLRQVISNTSHTAADIASASLQLQAASRELSSASEHAAGQVSAIATASEEMAATSNDISRNCASAAETSHKSAETAHSGEQVVKLSIAGMTTLAGQVQQVAQTVGALGARSDQIGAIVGTIEDIADQTNLLALNAAIEAARAGEQGRGFAVVADEVRALAERTTKATREIGEMIKAIQLETQQAVHAMSASVAEVDKGVQAAEDSQRALQEIMARIDEMTGQVGMIATAAGEQTTTTAEISSNLHQVTDTVQKTARGSDETASAAAMLARQAQELNELVRHFRV